MLTTNYPTNSLAAEIKRTTLTWAKPTSEISEERTRFDRRYQTKNVELHSEALHKYLKVWRSTDTERRK